MRAVICAYCSFSGFAFVAEKLFIKGMLSFIQNLGAMEIFLIFMIILLLFGAKRLPELFRSFGRSLGEFKKATREIEDEFRDAMDTENSDKKPSQSQAGSVPQPGQPDAAPKEPAATGNESEKPSQ